MVGLLFNPPWKLLAHLLCMRRTPHPKPSPRLRSCATPKPHGRPTPVRGTYHSSPEHRRPREPESAAARPPASCHQRVAAPPPPSNGPWTLCITPLSCTQCPLGFLSQKLPPSSLLCSRNSHHHNHHQWSSTLQWPAAGHHSYRHRFILFSPVPPSISPLSH
jgi:hypothetical protein